MEHWQVWFYSNNFSKTWSLCHQWDPYIKFAAEFHENLIAVLSSMRSLFWICRRISRKPDQSFVVNEIPILNLPPILQRMPSSIIPSTENEWRYIALFEINGNAPPEDNHCQLNYDDYGHPHIVARVQHCGLIGIQRSNYIATLSGEGGKWPKLSYLVAMAICKELAWDWKLGTSCWQIWNGHRYDFWLPREGSFIKYDLCPSWNRWNVR